MFIDVNILKNRELNAQDVRVYMTIASFTDKNGVCFPSVAKIADICGISRRSVFRILSKLTELKVIRREHRIRDDGGFSSNSYLVTQMSLPSDTAVTGGSDTDVTGVSDTDVTANTINLNNNVNLKFTKGARVHTREKAGKVSNLSLLEMRDLNDVKSCKEKLPQAKQYQFVKLASGAIGIRPLSAIGQNDIIEADIIKFLADKCGRDVVTLDFNSFSLNEIKIDI